MPHVPKDEHSHGNLFDLTCVIRQINIGCAHTCTAVKKNRGAARETLSRVKDASGRSKFLALRHDCVFDANIARHKGRGEMCGI